MPESTTLSERQARVAQVIAMLGLHDCADTYVGDALTRGISGGQLKRYVVHNLSQQHSIL
jgi:ABC-type multidrug transport system ATPase subunit